MTLTTLVFVIQNDHILLGLKKRGFGAGKWNGAGGKVQPNERIEASAQREIKEEFGIQTPELRPAGVLEFVFNEDESTKIQCHVFTTHTFTGTPAESEEMRPKWFDINNIPYDHMWEDDPLWLPDILHNKTVSKRFYFTKENTLTHHEEIKLTPPCSF